MTTPPDDATIGVHDATTPAGSTAGISARSTRAASTPDRRPELARGTMIGRYQIIRLLGRGGMGAVYAAHDPKLDRQVALKLLLSARGTDAADRMVREAQALARLDDPHVVQVYDSGEHDGQVFIAMQLVDGEDLGVALSRRRANSSQILAWFVDAGRGLVAAHAAGLVHRDFKPNNVLIDRRGRVAVTDFGIARDLAPSSGRAITHVGAIMGTPAYMSPEQHTAMPTTEASDQFSFCVAVWEALFERHPFVGERAQLGSMSPFEIGYHINSGEVIAPPKTRVSRRVIDALTRGLARDPAQRWPSMTPLLAELAPARKRRAWPIVAGGILVAAAAGGVGVGLAMSHGSDAPTCATKSAERATAAWAPPAAQQIRDRFTKTGRPYADVAAGAVQRSLDRYATRWQQLQTDVCTAELAAAGAPPELVVRRRACLDGRLDALRGVVALLTGEDRPEFVDHAGAMADALPALGDCNDADALLAAPSVPPAIAPQVAQLASQLAAAEARRAGGDYTRARDDVAAILGRAEQLAWAPLQARAHLALGAIHVGMIEPGRDELAKGIELAIANRMDRDAARGLAVAVLSAGTERAAEAFDSLVPISRAAAARTKDPIMIATAELDRARAIVRLHRYRDGVTACRAVYATAQTLDDKELVTGARDCLIEALRPLDENKELAPLVEQLIADGTRDLGADHPRVTDYLLLEVDIDMRAGKLADARKTGDRVLEIRRRVYPPRHFKIMEAIAKLAEIAGAQNKQDEALALNRQALELGDENNPQEVVPMMSILVTLGMHAAATHQRPEALAYLERAVALVKRHSPGSIELAIVLLNYGQVKAVDNIDAGLGLIGEAREILERNHDARAGVALGAYAVIAYNAKRWPEARKAAEDALASMTPNDDPDHLATMKWMLAEALVQTHGDRKRARTLASDARAIYVKLGPSYGPDVKQIDAFLKKR